MFQSKTLSVHNILNAGQDNKSFKYKRIFKAFFLQQWSISVSFQSVKKVSRQSLNK